MKKITLSLVCLFLLCGLSRAATLEWDLNPEPDVAGYNVFGNGCYLGTVYHPVSSWQVPDGLTGTHVFRVTAFDWMGNESEKSDPVVYVHFAPVEDTTAPAIPQIVISIGK